MWTTDSFFEHTYHVIRIEKLIVVEKKGTTIITIN